MPSDGEGFLLGGCWIQRPDEYLAIVRTCCYIRGESWDFSHPRMKTHIVEFGVSLEIGQLLAKGRMVVILGIPDNALTAMPNGAEITASGVEFALGDDTRIAIFGAEVLEC